VIRDVDEGGVPIGFSNPKPPPVMCHRGPVKVLLVAVLGAAGVLCRYGIGTAAGTPTFPWATLGINIAGCFALGVVVAAGPSKLSPAWQAGIGVGFLGGFTTFSTFGVETQSLLRDERAAAAALYVGLSVLVGVTAAFIGFATGRAFAD
jgi:fluoride exporter